MTTVLITHRVADYDGWRAIYDEVTAGPLGSDVLTYRVWRSQDDPNLVIIAETYESREVAEAAFTNPALSEVIANAGVDTTSMRIDYMDEVAVGTRRFDLPF
jgi:quinol monooxygenase YgiN